MIYVITGINGWLAILFFTLYPDVLSTFIQTARVHFQIKDENSICLDK